MRRYNVDLNFTHDNSTQYYLNLYHQVRNLNFKSLFVSTIRTTNMYANEMIKN